MLYIGNEFYLSPLRSPPCNSARQRNFGGNQLFWITNLGSKAQHLSIQQINTDKVIAKGVFQYIHNSLKNLFEFERRSDGLRNSLYSSDRAQSVAGDCEQTCP